MSQRLVALVNDGVVTAVVVSTMDAAQLLDSMGGVWPPAGYTLVDATGDAEPGGTWDGNAFTRAPVSTVPTPPSHEELAAAAFVARTTIADQVRAETFPLADTPKVAALFPEWAPGLDVTAGRIWTYQGQLVECVQSHTTQADWAPDVTPAMWKVHRDPDVAAEWVQPTGSTDAYPKDAKVTHNSKTWKSNVAANVWEPPEQWTEV